MIFRSSCLESFLEKVLEEGQRTVTQSSMRVDHWSRSRIDVRRESMAQHTPANVLLILAAFACLIVCCSTGLLAATHPSIESNQNEERIVALPNSTGFLFLDGEYLEAPYVIELAPLGRLLINGHRIRPVEYDGLPSESDDVRESIGGASRWLSGRGSDRRMAKKHPSPRSAEHRVSESRGTERLKRSENLKQQLEVDLLRSHHAVVLLNQGSAPVVLESVGGSHLFLELLCNQWGQEQNPSTVRTNVLDSLQVSPGDRERLAQLAASYVPSDSFLQRASAAIEYSDLVEEVNEQASSQYVAKEKLAYPLTILAMILVAIGFGHLLSNKPVLDESDEKQRRIRSRTVVARSVTIFLLLSVVDLVWTLFSAHTGSMRELNPIGGDLIGNPMQLIAFKTSLVGLTAGVLYFLHDRSIAQAASWWSCLVLTLLTARWVVFQSMFL